MIVLRALALRLNSEHREQAFRSAKELDSIEHWIHPSIRDAVVPIMRTVVMNLMMISAQDDSHRLKYTSQSVWGRGMSPFMKEIRCYGCADTNHHRKNNNRAHRCKIVRPKQEKTQRGERHTKDARVAKCLDQVMSADVMRI
jgi:hypothetical protein